MSTNMEQKWLDANSRIKGFPKYKLEKAKSINNGSVNKHQAPLNIDIINGLKVAMEEKRLNYTDIAEKIGVSRSNISYIFTGARTLNVRTIEKLAEAIGCRVSFKIEC